MEQVEQILKKINFSKSKKFTATVGFDGFIDEIYYPIKTSSMKQKSYFNQLSEFGEHLAKLSGSSCDIEICFQTLRPGGSGPLLAHALGTFGVSTTCFTAIDGHKRLFTRKLSSNCQFISLGKPGRTIALEFKYGKLMLGDTDSFNEIGWNRLQEQLTKNNCEKLLTSDLLAMVGWSHIPGMTDIWRGILTILPDEPGALKPLLFIDFADPGARNEADIKETFQLMHDFRKHFFVILGMNKNEASVIHSRLALKCNAEDYFGIAHLLVNAGYISEVVIHMLDSAYAVSSSQRSFVEVPLVHNSVVMTGAGDNFNGGYCWSRLIGMDTCEASIIGAITARSYISTGLSASIKKISENLIDIAKMIKVQRNN